MVDCGLKKEVLVGIFVFIIVKNRPIIVNGRHRVLGLKYIRRRMEVFGLQRRERKNLMNIVELERGRLFVIFLFHLCLVFRRNQSLFGIRMMELIVVRMIDGDGVNARLQPNIFLKMF